MATILFQPEYHDSPVIPPGNEPDLYSQITFIHLVAPEQDSGAT